MSEPTNFYDSPVGEINPDGLLDKPFFMARVIGFVDEATPQFELVFGAGMQKEDVPLVVDMLYEIFLPEIEARYEADAAAFAAADSEGAAGE